jgi:hypothetical protein
VVAVEALDDAQALAQPFDEVLLLDAGRSIVHVPPQ